MGTVRRENNAVLQKDFSRHFYASSVASPYWKLCNLLATCFNAHAGKTLSFFLPLLSFVSHAHTSVYKIAGEITHAPIEECTNVHTRAVTRYYLLFTFKVPFSTGAPYSPAYYFDEKVLVLKQRKTSSLRLKEVDIRWMHCGHSKERVGEFILEMRAEPLMLK